jgi:autotransporter-associated beta strand protein
VTSTRRVRINDAWTATFSYLMGAVNWAPQDAFSFFVHNDPRGPGAVGNSNIGAGYEGIARSTAVRWCTYPGHPEDIRYKAYIGHNGGWDGGSGQSYAPIVITAAETSFTIRYDPVAATLTVLMTQGATTVTHVFSNVNIPADVGDDYAYVGFGAGNGGACNEVRIRNFRMTSDTPFDALPNQQALASLILPDASTNTVTLDTSVPGASFRVNAVAVGAGVACSLDAVSQPGTLNLGSVTQAGAAAYPVAAGCTLVLTDVAGGTTVTKSGSGTLALAGAVATYTGSTVLSAGTLALDAARLPPGSDLHVSSGAALNLAFTGRQYVHALFVDGAAMPGGRYTADNTTWITGPGALIVTFPPTGTLLLFR